MPTTQQQAGTRTWCRRPGAAGGTARGGRDPPGGTGTRPPGALLFQYVPPSIFPHMRPPLGCGRGACAETKALKFFRPS